MVLVYRNDPIPTLCIPRITYGVYIATSYNPPDIHVSMLAASQKECKGRETAGRGGQKDWFSTVEFKSTGAPSSAKRSHNLRHCEV